MGSVGNGEMIRDYFIQKVSHVQKLIGGRGGLRMQMGEALSG